MSEAQKLMPKTSRIQVTVSGPNDFYSKIYEQSDNLKITFV